MGYNEIAKSFIFTGSGDRKKVFSWESNLIPKEPHPNKVSLKFQQHPEFDFDS